MNFKPIGSQILLEYVENKSVGDILLPEGNVAMDNSMFVVRAVGEGFLMKLGEWTPLPVKVGDHVKLAASALGKLSALEPWLVDGKKLAVVDIAHVLGIWEGELPKLQEMRKVVRAVRDNGNPVTPPLVH